MRTTVLAHKPAAPEYWKKEEVEAKGPKAQEACWWSEEDEAQKKKEMMKRASVWEKN